MTEIEIFILDLVRQADAGKHSVFTFIRNWRDFRNIKNKKRTIKLTLDCLQATANKTIVAYCNSIKANNSNLNQLLAYKTLERTILFFTEELRILNDIIAEYNAYLDAGNFINSWFFSQERPKTDLFDYRKR